MEIGLSLLRPVRFVFVFQQLLALIGAKRAHQQVNVPHLVTLVFCRTIERVAFLTDSVGIQLIAHSPHLPQGLT